MIASGLHISTSTLIVIALVLFIIICLLWLFGRLHR